MIEIIERHYAYFFIFVLMVIGLYGVLLKQDYVKKLIGVSILQSSIILFFIASAAKWRGTVPVTSPGGPPPLPEFYMNPLPHTLMLTAIVVSAATIGVAFSLLITIYRRYQSLDEETILERMK
jgi:multicomponent Na+:H+ antiporter subunit C